MTRRPASRSRSWLAIACGVCVLLVSVGSEHGLPGLIKAREQARRLAADVAALQAENAALRVRIEELRNDPAVIERVARRDLGLARPDEVVVTVKPAHDSAKP